MQSEGSGGIERFRLQASGGQLPKEEHTNDSLFYLYGFRACAAYRMNICNSACMHKLHYFIVYHLVLKQKLLHISLYRSLLQYGKVRYGLALPGLAWHGMVLQSTV